MDRIMAHLIESATRTNAVPMHKIEAVAMSWTRRQDEICCLIWDDLDVEGSRILVRSRMHLGEKVGNDVWVGLPPESLRIILTMPRVDRCPVLLPFLLRALCRAAKISVTGPSVKRTVSQCSSSLSGSDRKPLVRGATRPGEVSLTDAPS
jgi:hypothetical protein